MASNIPYTNITQVTFDQPLPPVVIISLKHLFFISNAFVNVVFTPFSTIEDFIFDVASRNHDLGAVLTEWQTVLFLEAGFVTCLFFGFAFVILFPIIGLIICYYRICSERCGGLMVQSQERARSQWRHFLFFLLVLVTLCSAFPCIPMFVTNEWMKKIITSLPEKIAKTVSGVSAYMDSLTSQVAQLAEQYGRVDAIARPKAKDLRTSLGEPLQATLALLAIPTLDKLSKLYSDFQDSVAGLQIMESFSATLATGIANLNPVLAARRQALVNDLSNPFCNANPVCRNIQLSTGSLTPTGANFSSVVSLQTEINSIQNTITTYDMNKEIAVVTQLFNNIPQLVVNGGKDVENSLSASLTKINDTLTLFVSQLPLDAVKTYALAIEQAGSSTIAYINEYTLEYDLYRYIGGILLGLMIIIILLLYWLGIGFGTKHFSNQPMERNDLSNLGGIFIMSAVGLTFVFSWLLMLLVMGLFTAGGHAERYVCQSLEPPYQGLKLLDRLMKIGGLSGFRLNSSIYKLVVDCEINKPIYEALDLDEAYNFTELFQKEANRTKDIRNDLNNIRVNLSTIKIHSPQIQLALRSMNNSGLDNIDLSTYMTQMSLGLTTSDLTQYALYLNTSAAAMLANGSLNALGQQTVNTIRSHSNAILRMHSTMVVPLEQALGNLNNTYLIVQNISTGFNRRIDDLNAALKRFDADISTNGSQYVLDETQTFADILLSDIDVYADWFQQQIVHNFGACRPLYQVYTSSISLVCENFIDVLNGMWFSLGWSLVSLIPATAIGLKLAKFYRRMHEEVDEEWLEVDQLDKINSRYDHLNLHDRINAASAATKRTSKTSVGSASLRQKSPTSTHKMGQVDITTSGALPVPESANSSKRMEQTEMAAKGSVSKLSIRSHRSQNSHSSRSGHSHKKTVLTGGTSDPSGSKTAAKGSVSKSSIRSHRSQNSHSSRSGHSHKKTVLTGGTSDPSGSKTSIKAGPEEPF